MYFAIISFALCACEYNKPCSIYLLNLNKLLKEELEEKLGHRKIEILFFDFFLLFYWGNLSVSRAPALSVMDLPGYGFASIDVGRPWSFFGLLEVDSAYGGWDFE